MPSVCRPFLLFAVALTSCVALPADADSAERPNIVWIVSEDNSIHYLDHFFEGGADTPHIKSMAAHGLTYDHAYSNAPVCSVARTTLATGCYGPRIGTQFHRRYRPATMPPGLRMFPAYLREAGYFTTNNSKKDYNAVEGKGVWDESSNKASWRNRPDKDQPFFHMQSHGESHESRLHFSEQSYRNDKTSHDPQSVKLADYHPDTPLFRYTHARYLDRMQTIDEIVGKTIAKLEEDGLLEDTFVFYFGDHGGVLPRSKGYLYDSGLHVPLVVRVPENFRDLVDAKDGSRIGGFVSFVDFGPTTLNLAGVKCPDQVDGQPFLGDGVRTADVNKRDTAFGYADRFDEKNEMIRSLHQGRFQYIRHYQPYLPDGLNNNYRYKNLAFAEWRDMYYAGKLEGPTKQFFEPKQVEHLYDCDADPHQVNNLAESPEHRETLLKLRGELSVLLKEMPDLSFYPESFLTENAMENPVSFGQEHRQEIGKLVDVADLGFHSFSDARPKLEQALKSTDPMERFWAATVCASFGEQAASLASAVRPLLTDESNVVRIRAADFLGRVGAVNPQPTLVEIVNTTKNEVEATEALNSIVWFKDFFDGRYPVQRDSFHPVAQGGNVDDRLNYINGVPFPKQNRVKSAPRRKQGAK